MSIPILCRELRMELLQQPRYVTKQVIESLERLLGEIDRRPALHTRETAAFNRSGVRMVRDAYGRQVPFKGTEAEWEQRFL